MAAAAGQGELPVEQRAGADGSRGGQFAVRGPTQPAQGTEQPVEPGRVPLLPPDLGDQPGQLLAQRRGPLRVGEWLVRVQRATDATGGPGQRQQGLRFVVLPAAQRAQERRGLVVEVAGEHDAGRNDRGATRGPRWGGRVRRGRREGTGDGAAGRGGGGNGCPRLRASPAHVGASSPR
ncbi:hypothetical protein AQ490_02445 [Wenjunlia vitaminophila]|uniref:Uncharacterized protein n=1 Tax=Wenjunlia vitaminophila TaxID=76728 RepID=A0A0T6LYE3_WENVI|nr:hypothetical protein AQ490_02445 [Wenjunlia vitaminophila]